MGYSPLPASLREGLWRVAGLPKPHDSGLLNKCCRSQAPHPTSPREGWERGKGGTFSATRPTRRQGREPPAFHAALVTRKLCDLTILGGPLSPLKSQPT